AEESNGGAPALRRGVLRRARRGSVVASAGACERRYDSRPVSCGGASVPGHCTAARDHDPLEHPMAEIPHPRSIRSFVTRTGRITEAQQRALQELWPVHGVEFQSEPLDLTTLFGRGAPCTVEIGFGNGDNLIALAGSHAERNYLGIEVHRAGVGRVLLS